VRNHRKLPEALLRKQKETSEKMRQEMVRKLAKRKREAEIAMNANKSNEAKEPHSETKIQ